MARRARRVYTLEKERALRVFGVSDEVQNAEVSTVEHHLALQSVQRVVGDVGQRRRQATHGELLRESHASRASNLKREVVFTNESH